MEVEKNWPIHLIVYNKFTIMFTNSFFLTKPIFQIRSIIRTRTCHLATRWDQPRHTRSSVQNYRGWRTPTSGRTCAIPGACHQDGRIPGRKTRALPSRQAVPRAHWKESPSARRQTVPRARVQNQAHLPRTQVG